MTPTTWRPRASSLGHYWACSQRAAFDRGIHEGIFSPDMKEDNPIKPNAALGTCIHFFLQDGLRAVFPGPSQDYAPEEDEYESASKLFGGSRQDLMRAVEASARLAAQHMPKLPNGSHWRAEVAVDAGPHLSPGHIDFLSSDGAILVDLKTTSRKPSGGRIKRSDLIQVTNYALNSGAQWAMILYVDSMCADWCMPIPIPYDTNEPIRTNIPKLVRYLTGPTLNDTAYPGPLNDDCNDTFCGYTKICRDEIVPRGERDYSNTTNSNIPTGVCTI
jgi:hypothetical protein